MSRPGDSGRTQIMATGFEQTLARTAEIVGAVKGARSFEISYDAVDRTLAADEEPRPDERVRWTATAVVRRRGVLDLVIVDRTYTGESIAEPGRHGRGVSMACVDLLEQLGVNTVVLDLTTKAAEPT